MTGGLRVSVLGPVRIWRDDVELNLGRPLQRAVFGVLAMNARQAVSLRELIDAVWGDDVPPTVEGNLYTYISGLRRLVGPDAAGLPRIRGERSSYLLRLDPGQLDATTVQRAHERATLLRIDGSFGEAVTLLDEALSQWRGLPFSDVPGPFASAQRDRLTALREMLVEERAELMLRSGRAPETIDDLVAEVRAHPLRERLRGLLMIALYRSGRQRDALDQYHQAGLRLAGDLGVDPGPALQQLYRRIHRGDRPSEVTAWPAEAQYVPGRHTPKQLPREHVGFVGRERELTELHALLPAPGDVRAPRPLAVIDGAGGIGKTALAVRFAHEVAERFPGGQLFIRLHGCEPDQPPLTASAALDRLLRDLGVAPAAIPTELAEQAALYRSILADRDVLIVLDDALSAEQVRPLLPGGRGCLVLVTSRNRLSGLTIRDGARRVALDALSEAESVSMLGARRADEQVAAELARLCGGLPLALRIAGEQVALTPGLTLSGFVHQLTDERARLDALSPGSAGRDTVRHVLSRSYRALPPGQARLFCLLGLHPGTEFGLGAVAALANAGVRAARREAEALIACHVLEYAGKDRYRRHELVRIHAAEMADRELSRAQRRRASNRMFSWYLHSAAAAARTLAPGRRLPDLEQQRFGDCPHATFDDRPGALAWCETERETLVALTRLALTAGEHTMAWQLPGVLWPFFHLRKHWDDWLRSHEHGLRAAELAEHRSGRAWLLNGLAWAYIGLGRGDEAVAHAAESLALRRKLGDQAGEAAALSTLGVAYHQHGRAPRRSGSSTRGSS